LGEIFVMATTEKKPVTPQEYLKRERPSKNKHEYFDGTITALAGASMAHNDITINLFGEVRNFLKGKPCRILPNDMRVSSPTRNAYMYPDAMIVCGTPELEDDKFDTLKNPVVIFEILSPSTREHDRVTKFGYYRQIPSFREYVLIDSTACFVEISRRQVDGSWEFEATADPFGHIFISSIHCPLSMEELYSNVSFATKK